LAGWRLTFAALLFLASPSAAVASGVSSDAKERAGDVVVRAQAPQIKVQFFNSTIPGAVAPLARRRPKTKWFFHCRPHFTSSIVHQEGRTLTFKVNSVNFDLSLTITTAMPQNAGEPVIAHERWHREICRRVYKAAGTIARQKALALIGSEFKGSGDTNEAARNAAHALAAKMLCTAYCQETARRASEISARYDDLTRHGTNQSISPEIAAEQAFRHFDARADRGSNGSE
jgi:hypothetical protein